MDEHERPLPTIPTAAWLTEQEAKQEAYAAKRRAWVQKLGHDTVPDEEEAPDPSPSPPRAPSSPTTMQGTPPRRSRGLVHDPRQKRFEF
jgi:hypothetical protein